MLGNCMIYGSESRSILSSTRCCVIFSWILLPRDILTLFYFFCYYLIGSPFFFTSTSIRMLWEIEMLHSSRLPISYSLDGCWLLDVIDKKMINESLRGCQEWTSPPFSYDILNILLLMMSFFHMLFPQTSGTTFYFSLFMIFHLVVVIDKVIQMAKKLYCS